MKKEDVNIKEVIENETGRSFKRNFQMCCPFHKEKTPSFSIKNEKFKCFGCGESGDVIDFIGKFKGYNYVEACKYLNIDLDEERQAQESDKEKIKESCKRVFNSECKEIYSFTDEEGKVLYYEIKFYKEGKKEVRPCRILNGLVVFNMGGINKVPYNLNNIKRAITEDKNIFIVEGPKDSDTLRYLGYKATSFKGVKNFDYSLFTGAKVFVIGDTGKAGYKYLEEVKNSIFNIVKSFTIVNLPGLEALGDNKDVTDWIEAGNTKEDLKKAIYKSLDLKNKYELQQDFKGVYKTTFKESKEDVKETITYITNFRVISAKNIRFIDEEKEGIELILLSQDGETFSRSGEVNVFNDVKSFKNFLGTMALTFSGKMSELDDFKNWIYKYFTNELDNIYTGIQFIDNKLITPNGAITKSEILKDTFCKSNIKFNLNNNILTGEEAKELVKHLFSFNKEQYCCSILGSIVNNMAYDKLLSRDIKLHHLLIIGESGSGKSTTKKAVINPILGYNNQYEGVAMGNITKFALTKALSEGNYTKVFDEYKPSKMNSHNLIVVSDLLRNSYDRMTVDRGNKDQSITEYKLKCPVVLCGEEGFKDEEKALIERSLIIYLSKAERPKESKDHLNWLQNNDSILNKLGSTILNKILSMSTEEYFNIRSLYNDYNNNVLEDRPLNTFLNACTGFHVLKDILEDISGVTLELDYIEHIKNVIKDNVLQGGEETNAIYENMLLKINDMVENTPYLREDTETYKIVIDKDKTYIRVNLILADLSKYNKDYNLNIPLLSKSDFIKQCEKSGYITNKQVKKNNVRTVEFNTDKLYKLGCYELIGRGIVERKDKEHLKLVKTNELIEKVY